MRSPSLTTMHADRDRSGDGQDLANALLVGIAEEQAARLAPDLAEPLAAFADRRRVDQRQHLLHVVHQQRVEQRLVGVLQIAQEGVALEIGVESTQRLQPARDLLVQGADVRRQQPMQGKVVRSASVKAVPLLSMG